MQVHSDSENHPHTATLPTLPPLPASSIESSTILQCLQTSSNKISDKQVISEIINEGCVEKEKRNLKDVERELQGWDEFEANFIHQKMESKKEKPRI